MEPEATQNIIHQKHPIPSSWHIHQSVSYSKDGFILLMLISFTGRLVIYLSVAIRKLVVVVVGNCRAFYLSGFFTTNLLTHSC